MAVTRIITCDVCSSKIPYTRVGETGKRRQRWRLVRVTEIDGQLGQSGYDVCDKCMSKIKYACRVEEKFGTVSVEV